MGQSTPLNRKTVAVLATDGFEQIELTAPIKALRDAGATVDIVSLKAGEIQGFNQLMPGDKVRVDKVLAQTNPSDYDALVLPGGLTSPDRIRADDKALGFIRAFTDMGKPVAAIDHAPWLFIDAGATRGRTMTGYKSIHSDLRNAGAKVVDKDVVVDHGLITSRDRSDVPSFCATMVREFANHSRSSAY